MGKRKSTVEDKAAAKMDVDGENDSGTDDASPINSPIHLPSITLTSLQDSILNVDFEWFDPQPAIDFHGIKNLLKQLFDVDNQLFDLSALTDLILGQPLLGSTVKTEGNESDPFAFLTVLNMQQHRELPVMKELSSYLAKKATATTGLEKLKPLLEPVSKAQVGLVLTERFINMPHQIVPPMYTMLQEELAWALDEKEPYEFTHYLVISKAYTEVASKLDLEDDRPKKKSKAQSKEQELFYFHPEDEVLQKHALAAGSFEYEKVGEEGASDAKRAFQELGVRPQGLAVLIEAGKFADAVKAVGEYLGAS